MWVSCMIMISLAFQHGRKSYKASHMLVNTLARSKHSYSVLHTLACITGKLNNAHAIARNI